MWRAFLTTILLGSLVICAAISSLDAAVMPFALSDGAAFPPAMHLWVSTADENAIPAPADPGLRWAHHGGVAGGYFPASCVGTCINTGTDRQSSNDVKGAVLVTGPKVLAERSTVIEENRVGLAPGAAFDGPRRPLDSPWVLAQSFMRVALIPDSGNAGFEPDGDGTAGNTPPNGEEAGAEGKQPTVIAESAGAGDPPASSSGSETATGEESRAVQPAQSGQKNPIKPATRVRRGAVNPANPTVSNADETLTFIPGMRLQSRYVYDDQNGNHSVYVARLRLKAKGGLFGRAQYGTEIKIDNLGRAETDPRAELENAWLEMPVSPDLAIRAGLYDVPFSRNALTSDSRLLFVDRSLIKDALTRLGLADNTIGLMGHGRPLKGRLEYAAGIFNNLQFKRVGTSATKQSDSLMKAGRIAFNFLDPAKRGGYADYQSSYLGQGRRLSLGAHAARLRDAREGANEFNLSAWGLDLFFNRGPLTLEAEYGRFREDMLGATPALLGDGWFAQAGYLLPFFPFELIARHQQLDPDHNLSDNRLRWTSLGGNIYIRDHYLKLQTEYTFRRGQVNARQKGLVQVQLQFDF
jgi:hypothetical protein